MSDKIQQAHLRVDVKVAVNMLKKALEQIGVDVKAAMTAIHAQHVKFHYDFTPEAFIGYRSILMHLTEQQEKQLKASFDVMDSDELLMMWESLIELATSIDAKEAHNMSEVFAKLYELAADAKTAYEVRTGEPPSISHIPDQVLTLKAAERITKKYPKDVPFLFDEME